MNEEARNELRLLERKNVRIFQIMGALKLLNNKVKSFVMKLERTAAEEQNDLLLNQSFGEIINDIRFFKEEHKRFVDSDLYIPIVDKFANNVDRLFHSDTQELYTHTEMRRISVYLYRMSDMMIRELMQSKSEIEQKIHAIHLANGKYYFNRK